ncbi:MAG: hypothetical protein ABI528_07660 [bacterium]
MIKSKLIDLLKTFTQPEFSEFGKFLNSPFHNESQTMIRLYNCFKKYFPGFDSEHFTKENIYSELYGDVKFDDKKHRERFSDMHKLSEEYLALVEFRINPLEVKRNTLLQFSRRDLETDFNKKYKEIQDILDKMEVKNEFYFYHCYQQYQDKRDFFETRPVSGKKKHYYDELTAEIEQHTLFFMSRMLIYFTMMHNKEGFFKYDFDFGLYDFIMKYISEKDFEPYPVLKSYYLLLKLVRNKKDEKSYYELKEHLLKNSFLIKAEDKVLIFTELFNYTVFASYKGLSEFEKEKYEIMNLQLEQETYPVERLGWMELGYYMSYVIIAISMSRLEEAEKFIKDYTEKLNPERKKNGNAFVKGLLHYAQKKYDTAIQDLSIIRKVDFNIYIRSRTLLVKIYFDIQNYETVLTAIDTFKHYLSSNPLIPEYLNKKYTNFMNVLRKLTLLSLNLTKDDYNLYKLEKEINSFSVEDITTHKSWLLEKLHSLKGT